MSPGEGSLFPGLLGRDGFQRLGPLRLAKQRSLTVPSPLHVGIQAGHSVALSRATTWLCKRATPAGLGIARGSKRRHSCKCSTWMKPVLTQPPRPGLQSREACREPRQEGWTGVYFSGLRTCPLVGSGNRWGRRQTRPLCIPAWTGSEQKTFCVTRTGRSREEKRSREVVRNAISWPLGGILPWSQKAAPACMPPDGSEARSLQWGCLLGVMNGSSHSPTAINGAPSTPNGFSNGPATSSTASLSNHQLPPACGARQLSKLKRFLTTLQQFGSDISPEIGERVRTLVLGLVNSTLTIEEFHSKLQEATNFPLRPFVIPFLKANLPLLQRELLHCARMAKQSPAQYLAQHEQLLLDANASSPIDSSELLLEVNEGVKRRTPDRTKENGLDRDSLHPEHLSKRPCTLSPAQRYSPSNGLSHQPNGLPHPTPPPPQHYRLEDMAVAHRYRDTYRPPDPRDLREHPRPAAVHSSRQEEVIDHRLTEREWAEEWKHLNNLLNCIMDMVEKTRRSLTVLRRCQEADREELNHWIRRYSDAEDMKKGPSPASRPLSSTANLEAPLLDAHREFVSRPLSGYMPEEIWRKAEEAVNEVKRQAMSELQKAVSDAERKAHELITTERAKMERALAEAKRQASEDALTVINQQEDSSESCWNCGRKASETCSGCNTARYCGSFCQHKDWEKHHHVCGQTLQSLQSSVGTGSSGPVGLPGAPAQPDGVAVTSSIPGVALGGSSSDPGSATVSRSGTPATPAPLDTTSR